MSDALTIYSQLFSPFVLKDERYFHEFYGTILHEQALFATLKNLSNEFVGEKSALLRELAEYGIGLLLELSAPRDVAVSAEQPDPIVDDSRDITELGEITEDDEQREPEQPPELVPLDLGAIKNVSMILCIFVQTVLNRDYGVEQDDMLNSLLDRDHLRRLLESVKENLQQKAISDFEVINLDSLRLLYEVVLVSHGCVFEPILYEYDFSRHLNECFMCVDMDNTTFKKLVVIQDFVLNREDSPYSSQLSSMEIDDGFLQRTKDKLMNNYVVLLKFYYNLKPDLWSARIKNEGFFNWITFNKFNSNGYLAYDFNGLLEHNLNEVSELTLKIKGLEYEKVKSAGKIDNTTIPNNELLSMTLYLYCLVTKSEEFSIKLTTQSDSPDDLKPDTAAEDDTDVELLELFLCYLSYLFQYKHNSAKDHLISRLSLMILFKLVKDEILVQKLAHYRINEYKYKLCHHHVPVIPTDISQGEAKSGLYYILDIVQCFMRFNLTNKMNLIDLKLNLCLIKNILRQLSLCAQINDDYNWTEFFKSIVSCVLFIVKQDFRSFRNEETVDSVVEEFLVIIDDLLVVLPGDLRADLIYKILLDFDKFRAIVQDYNLAGSAANVSNCLEYLNAKLNLDGKIPEFPYIEIDNENPKLMDKLRNYGASSERAGYRYKKTFQYDIKGDSLFSNAKITLINKCLCDIKRECSIKN